MFNTLVESKPKRERSTGSMVVSGVLHGLIIVFAVFATAKGTEIVQERRQEDVQFVEIQPDEPPPQEEAPPPDIPVAPPPPKGFQVLAAPVEIPTVIPDIDLTKQVTREEDFSGVGVAGGLASGVEGGTGVVTDQPYWDFQVDKPALAMPGNPAPRYPDVLRSAGVEGEVLAQFVVTENGRADMSTFKVLKSNHDLFTASVRSVLPRMRFQPAETGGRKVKMWVQQSFKFELRQS